jgi:hypothetical protein
MKRRSQTARASARTAHHAQTMKGKAHEKVRCLDDIPEAGALMAADRAERLHKGDSTGREPFAMDVHGDDPDVALNNLADEFMADANAASPKKKITYQQARAFVSEHHPVGRKLFRQSKMRSLAKNGTA